MFSGIRASFLALGLAASTAIVCQGAADAAAAPRGHTITATVSGHGVRPDYTISCRTPGAVWSVDRTVRGDYFTWSETTTCDRTITMSDQSVLYGGGGEAVSRGSDPRNQTASQISSSGAFGPGRDVYTLLYRVILTLPSGAGTWGDAGPGCSGAGTVTMKCDVTTLLS